MLLLHISDIHFREPDCLHLDTDPDHSYRTMLLRDVREQVAKLGKVDAMLVGGDIAYKGHPKEYEAASAWLKELAATCGCAPKERIFVVPGNHDVDRKVVTDQPSVRNTQSAIASAKPEHRERELRTQFNNADTGKSLLLPLAAYNDFAKFFNCQVYTPDHLYWKQDVPLQDGLHLRIYGLTSILLSGQNGKDDTRETLYLSPLQTVLTPADDVVNLVLIHHPPEWLLDMDDVDEAICARAALHLFGHKHRQRIRGEQDFVRYSAAAVIPGRDDRKIQPGYNLIELEVQGLGAGRRLEVRSHLQQWQSNPDRFRPVKTNQGKEVFLHHIAIPAFTDKKIPPLNSASTTADTHAVSSNASSDNEAAMGTEETRNIVYRFWNLTMSQRREIALKLELIDPSEIGLPEPERYGRALMRASERHLLDRLEEEIAIREQN